MKVFCHAVFRIGCVLGCFLTGSLHACHAQELYDTVSPDEKPYVQRLCYQPNHQLRAKIAQKGLTRLSVEGGRLVSLFVEEGILTQVADEASGQWFIQLKNPQESQSIALSLITEKGYTQDLLLEPTVIPSAAIQLGIPPKHQTIAIVNSESNISPESQILQAIMQGHGQPSTSRTFPKRLKHAAAWELQYRQEYAIDSWIISEWRVHNRTTKPIMVHEFDLYEPGDRVLSLRQRRLLPHQETALWIMRNRL